MRTRGTCDAETLTQQTEKFFEASRMNIRPLGLTDGEVRQNIRRFLEKLPELNEPDRSPKTKPAIP